MVTFKHGKIMHFTYFIGIDVSKDTLDFTVLNAGSFLFHLQVENSLKGIKQFVSQLKKSAKVSQENCLFCVEHTGIYNYHILEYVTAHSLPIWVESASRIKASAGLQRGKNDKVDSLRIAHYAYKNNDCAKLWKAPRTVINQLKRLLAMRQRCINLKKQASVPVSENASFSNKELSKLEASLFKQTLSALNKDLKSIERAIKEVIENDTELRRLFTLMTSISGIGPVIAAHVLVFTNEFKDFDNAKKFACYAGVVPFDHSSGKSIRGKSRVSHLAHKGIKHLLHMAALRVIQLDGELSEYFLRMAHKGKNKMLILNAIRNKLVHRIFAVVKTGVPYQKNYLNPLIMS